MLSLRFGLAERFDLGIIHFAALLLGSVFPDLDHPSSWIREWVTKLSLAGCVVLLVVFRMQNISLYFEMTLLVLILLFFVQFLHHRRWFHSVSALVLLCAPIAVVLPEVVPFFAAGFVSHLLLDKELSLR